MTAQTLSLFAGVVLSLLFSYVPGLRQRYAALDPDTKRLIMLAALVIVTVGIYGLACAGFAHDFGLAVTCDRAGAIGLAQAFIGALIANQATHRITPGQAK